MLVPKYSLMTHQREGVEFIDKMDGVAALLYDPGVGKTGTTLTWIDRMAARLGEFRVLVVAPLTATDTWVLQAPPFMDSLVKARQLQGNTTTLLTKIRQARDWTNVPDMPVGVDHKGKHLNQRVTILSMSAGALSQYCTDRAATVRVLQAVRKYAPHLIVVDESQIIKSPTANLSVAMYQLGQLSPHRIILTGTVNPHSILDCYGQWRFLAPWTFSDQAGEDFISDPVNMTKKQAASIRPWSWDRFKRTYTKPGGYKGKGIGGFQNEADLHDRVAQRSHVVRKEDALDLPPTSDVDIHVALTPREARAYKEMADDLAAQMDDGSMLEAVNALAKLMKLRQIAAGFVKDTDTGDIHIIGDSLRKGMTEIASTQLGGENRLVVFAYFRAECELVADMIRKAEKVAGRADTVVEVITGSTKPKDRLAIRRRFGDVSGNPTRTILVAQARTMSLSVNELVTAQHAIFGSYSERRDDWVQSRGRLDRNGQTAPVTFWNVYTPGLVGNIMLDRHKDRGDLEKALLDHVRAVAAGR